MGLFNSTNSEIFMFFWINYGLILFFIILWVLNILLWIIYIITTLRNIKRSTRQVQITYNNKEKVKELTVQLWKFRLLLLISLCEMFALLIAGLTICMHRILRYYNSDIVVEIALSYIHDFLYIICLYLLLTVLKLLNITIRYLIGVYNWEEYKPDKIKDDLKFILIESLVLFLLAGLWIPIIPLGVILIIRSICEYVKHVKGSIQLCAALRGMSTEYKRQNNSEGDFQYRQNKKKETNYRWFTRWLMTGVFFWMLASAISLTGVILNQAGICLKLQHIELAVFNEITSHKIYLIFITDLFIFTGGVVLFPVHILYTLMYFTKSQHRVSGCCYCRVKTEKQTDLTKPLVNE
ncbi:hypothetical protein LOD99_4604 [Oopsacas minuta]|uniref:G-protein coupled receptors family 1 profile domain-containing protein n=1 Tax=Oopsacas minuta TaxID=111878 RepID=A0AAV7JU88_9METZ|nr:hypothetical protein LOD99_4604 [Oopsacas minuta]